MVNKIYPRVKDFFNTDLDFDFNCGEPEDASNFGFTLYLTIGEDEVEGGTDFQITVCTPDWLKDHYLGTGPVFGGDLLIVPEFDRKAIKYSIQKRVDRCAGTTWEEVWSKVGQFSHWEYEGMRFE